MKYFNLFLIVTLSCSIGCARSGSEPLKETPKPTLETPQILVHKYLNAKMSKYLGLANVGNTCFANAVHKLLLAHPKSVEFTSENFVLDGQTQDFNQRQNIQKSIHGLLRGLKDNQDKLKNLDQASPGDRDPEHFSFELNLIFDHLKSWLKLYNWDGEEYFSKVEGRKLYLREDQMDAEEYLTRLLDILEYQKFFHPFELTHHFQFKGGQSKCLASREPVSKLNLSIDGTSIPVHSISDGIQAYFTPELVSGVLNGRTHSYEDAMVTSTFLAQENQVPQQLILTLNRFSSALDKIRRPIKLSQRIQIPYDLEWQEMMTSPLHSVEMGPVAVIVHRGESIGGGHYVTYLYDRKLDSWTLHDDKSVTKILPEHLPDALNEIEQDGYLFLYQEI